MTRMRVGRRVVVGLFVVSSMMGGCTGREFTAPVRQARDLASRQAAPRGEQLKFHVRGEKPWVVYVGADGLYSETGVRLPFKPQQVEMLTVIGRKYDEFDRVIQANKAKWAAMLEARPRMNDPLPPT